MLRPAPKPDSRAMLFVFITVLLSMIGIGIIMPVMPDLLLVLTGKDETQTASLNSYLLASYAVMQFIMSPVLGALSDRFGRRPVLLTSLFAYGLDYLFMALVPSYGWLFVGRMLSGAFAATFATASAFIADVSPPEKRASNFGMIGAAFGLGFIIGPAIGGFFGELNPRYPFFVASGLSFVNFVFGYLVFPETVTDATRRKFELWRANPFGGLIAVSRHPIVIGVLMAYFLMQFAHQSLPSIWSFYAKAKYGWSEAQIGWSLSYVGVTAAFVQGFLIRKVIPSVGETRAVITGITAMTISMLGYAFMSPSWHWVFWWISIGSLGGFMMPGMQGIMSRATPANAQGELQGAIASIMSMTMALSPLTMGYVFERFANPAEGKPFLGAPFVLSACILITAIIPFWLTMRNVPSKAEAEQAAV